ncbi:major capsid protein [Aestuariivirga sp.]|uniref:major capsid protein n=1 Tax=Aestuariivirga sp. TaxID=2650926 RepID=UPI0035949051
MATMDIFEGDAFTIIELTRALENIPFKPALLSGSNLFSPRGVRARTVMIESRDGTLSLIPFSERGSAYEQQVTGSELVFIAETAMSTIRKKTADGALEMPSPASGEVTLKLNPAETRLFAVGRLRSRYEFERRIGGTEETLVCG